MYLDLCEEAGFLSVILFLKKIIDILQLLIPIGLVIICAVDLGKMVVNPEEKSVVPKITKRMIAAVSIFFIPAILNILLEEAGQIKFTATTCWANANTSTISSLKAIKAEEEKARKEAAKKAEEEAKKKAEEEKAAEEAKKQQEEEESTELYHENGTDGKVDVIDGIFYKPSTNNSGAAGTEGSGPYGYNIYFYNRLKAFVDAAQAAGHDIRMSTSEYGAWRPYSNQKYFWDCYQTKKCNNGNLAARPGTSNHGWGIASDLSYYSGQHGKKEAKYWAHENAYKYGLKFPLCQNIRGYCQEDWHIEPAVLKRK